MKIESIDSPAFASYGKVLTGYNTRLLRDVLRRLTPLPEGVEYVPSVSDLESLTIAKYIEANAYGGMPVQLGYCNGHNTKLNCLEYHRDSELNCGTEDFILLLARVDEIENGKLDTSKVKAFRVPAGVLVEIYATTLHYAPCHTDPAKGFRVMVALPGGTNGNIVDISPLNEEDRLLWARNKWLLAHPDSAEAKEGAFIGLTGENIDIADDI